MCVDNTIRVPLNSLDLFNPPANPSMIGPTGEQGPIGMEGEVGATGDRGTGGFPVGMKVSGLFLVGT